MITFKKSSLIILLMVSAAFIVGCAKNFALNLVADTGQVDFGATIKIDGDDGFLELPVMDGLPKSPSGTLHVISRPNALSQSNLTLQWNGAATLTFFPVQGKYICAECALYSLPINWHVSK